MLVLFQFDRYSPSFERTFPASKDVKGRRQVIRVLFAGKGGLSDNLYLSFI